MSGITVPANMSPANAFYALWEQASTATFLLHTAPELIKPMEDEISTPEKVIGLIEQRFFVDYAGGRYIKVYFDKFPILNASLYDQEYGTGAAQRALQNYNQIDPISRFDQNDAHRFRDLTATPDNGALRSLGKELVPFLGEATVATISTLIAKEGVKLLGGGVLGGLGVGTLSMLATLSTTEIGGLVKEALAKITGAKGIDWSTEVLGILAGTAVTMGGFETSQSLLHSLSVMAPPPLIATSLLIALLMKRLHKPNQSTNAAYVVTVITGLIAGGMLKPPYTLFGKAIMAMGGALLSGSAVYKSTDYISRKAVDNALGALTFYH